MSRHSAFRCKTTGYSNGLATVKAADGGPERAIDDALFRLPSVARRHVASRRSGAQRVRSPIFPDARAGDDAIGRGRLYG